MSERKYEHLITTIKYDGRDKNFWDEDDDRRTLYGPAMYSREKSELAPFFLDIMELYGDDTGFGMGARAIMDGQEIVDTPHKHSVPEVFVFCGTNVDDPSDLGGEIEMWIGEGAEAEKYIFTEPTFVYLPEGLVHQPTWARNVRHTIICIDILLSPDFNIEPVAIYPPDYEGPERFKEFRNQFR